MSEPQTHQVGAITDDRRNHAVVRSWSGRHALCGAGRIVVVLKGDFDVHDLLACPNCVKKLRSDNAPT